MKFDVSLCVLLVLILFGCLSQGIDECEKLEKQAGKDFCYKNASLTRNDSSLCDKIQNQESRDNCYLQSLKNNPKSEVCNKINRNSQHLSECYLLAAIYSDNNAACSPFKIEELPKESVENYEDWKAECLFGVAVHNQKPEICDRLDRPENDVLEIKSLCHALANRDVESCSSLKSDAVKERCYLEFAYMNKDRSLCEKMELASNRSSYYKTGSEKCTIIGATLREDCYCAIIRKEKLEDTLERYPGPYLSSPILLIEPSSYGDRLVYNLKQDSIKRATIKLAFTADEISGLEPGTKREVEITMPYSVTNSSVSKNEVSISVWHYFNAISYYEETKANLTGCINHKIPGTRNVILETILTEDGKAVRIRDPLGCS